MPLDIGGHERALRDDLQPTIARRVERAANQRAADPATFQFGRHERVREDDLRAFQLIGGDRAPPLDYRKQAPFAERAHPTDEHLLPLFVALGAAGQGAQAQRLDAGVDLGILAMDIYRFDGAA